MGIVAIYHPLTLNNIIFVFWIQIVSSLLCYRKNVASSRKRTKKNKIGKMQGYSLAIQERRTQSVGSTVRAWKQQSGSEKVPHPAENELRLTKLPPFGLKQAPDGTKPATSRP
jgi:hypothetical protein